MFRSSRLALAAIVVLGAALRAYGLGTHSLWLDELEEGHSSRSALPQLLEYVRADAGGTPLDYLGVKLTTTIFGGGTVGTRLWAFAMGCLAIVLIFFVAEAWFKSAVAGGAAAALLALSPFHIYYSQEARPYALSVVAVLVILLLFHHALERGDWTGWLVFGGGLGAALYAHYFLAMLVAPAAVTVAAVRWGEWRRSGREAPRFAVGIGLAALLFAPWVFYSSIGQLHDLGWPPPPPLNPSRLLQVFDTLIGLGTLGLAQVPSGDFGPLHKREMLLTATVLVGASAGLLLELRSGRRVGLLVALVPIIAVPLAWFADQRQHYFWSERQVIFALPCLYLLAAAAIARVPFPRTLPRMAPAVAGASLLVWGVLSLGPIVKIYNGEWLPKADWRGASAFAASRSRADTRIYSFLDRQFAFGVAYYQPQLEGRAHSVVTSPHGLAAVDLKPDDLIIAPSDAPVVDLLTRSSYSYRDFFGGVRVYFHQG